MTLVFWLSGYAKARFRLFSFKCTRPLIRPESIRAESWLSGASEADDPERESKPPVNSESGNCCSAITVGADESAEWEGPSYLTSSSQTGLAGLPLPSLSFLLNPAFTTYRRHPEATACPYPSDCKFSGVWSEMRVRVSTPVWSPNRPAWLRLRFSRETRCSPAGWRYQHSAHTERCFHWRSGKRHL